MSDRSTHTDALDTLGTLITADEKRDAIHLAVYPVQAGQWLEPGECVQLDSSDRAVCHNGDGGLGIVDPFLKEDVGDGEWFWLVVHPRTITSLRHVWEHPAFPASGETVAVGGLGQRVSELWLRRFCTKHDIGFDMTVAAATGGPVPMGEYDETAYIDGGDFIFSGIEAWGDIPPEFWEHVERYTGQTIPDERRATSFRCHC